MNDKKQACGSVSSTELVQPIAYLYHDTSTPKDAHPWLHSTMLVLAADRREGLRGETPLVTLEQARAMVAAERERCTKFAVSLALICASMYSSKEQRDVCNFIAHELGRKPL